MSERLKASVNKHGSKNTRLAIADEFGNYRFGRDALAHTFRYLFICEWIIKNAKAANRPLSILDIGCGDVYVARVLVSSFRVKKTDIVARYVGFDIDDKSLARTQKTKPTSMPIELVCGDITDSDLARYQDKEFDLVVCTEVIEHIQPRFVPGLLEEIRRIASYALVSTPNFAGGTGSLPKDHIKEWTYAELSQAMSDAGIEILQEIGTFCNLSRVKELASKDQKVRAMYSFLERRMDSDLLSLCMARIIGTESQNILYVCRLRGIR